MKLILLIFPIVLFSSEITVIQQLDKKVNNKVKRQIIETKNVEIKENLVYSNEYKDKYISTLIYNIKATNELLQKIYQNKEDFFKHYQDISKLIHDNGNIYDGIRYYDTSFYLLNKKTFDIYNRLSLLLLQKFDYYDRNNIDTEEQFLMLEELANLIGKFKNE
jgi:hypothetical protein